MWSLLTGLFGAVGNGVSSWQDRKAVEAKAKHDLQIARIEAEADRVRQQGEAETGWDGEALRQSQFSWKDEWFVLLLSGPFIGSFVPGLQDHVILGWDYVARAPVWYQVCFMGAVCASFGLRWWFKRRGL